MKVKKVCFFAHVKDRSLLELMQWYKNDIEILKELGYNVVIASNFCEIPWNCDVYFSWWATTSIFPFIKAKIMHKPIVVIAGGSEVVHSSREIQGYKSKPFWIKLFIQISLRRADRVLAVSRSLLDEIVKLGANRVSLVYHGIRVDQFKPSYVQKDIVLTISHLNQENIARKKIYTIIEAIPYVKGVFPRQKFVFIGRKMKGFEDLQKKVNELRISDNVVFPGKVSNEEKIQYFSRALIYVQPTLHEAFGVATAEAMSCGLPVISSKVGAVREVLSDCGLYVNPDDHKNLADKIILLLRDEDLRRNLGERARKRVLQNFTYQRRKQEIQKILNDVLGKYP